MYVSYVFCVLFNFNVWYGFQYYALRSLSVTGSSTLIKHRSLNGHRFVNSNTLTIDERQL